MFTIKLDIAKNLVPELERRLKNLENSEVGIGMWEEQGQHYSGFSYRGLFQYLSEGDSSNNLVARPILDIAIVFNPLKSSPLKRELRKYLSDLNMRKSKRSVNRMLSEVGEFYRDKAFSLFGDEGAIAPNTFATKIMKEQAGFDPNKPFIQTGSLSKKIAYRIDNGMIMEHN